MTLDRQASAAHPRRMAKQLPPVVRDYLRHLQKLGAAAIKGTEAARIRASKAGSSVSKAAAAERARKAAAARHAKK